MTTIREALEAAAGEAEVDSAEVAPVEEVAPLEGSGGDDVSAAGAEGDGAAPTPGAEASEAEANAGEAARSRDPKGRFAGTKEGQAKADAPVKPTATVAAAVKPGAPGVATPKAVEPVRAPQAWTPAAREAFAKAPPEVQAEVNRREKQMATAMQEGANHRKFADSFNQVVSPYMGTIQAEGGNPLSAISSLLQTAQALRTAPPAHKATLVAKIIKDFGVPVESIAAALDGQAPPETQQGGYQDPRVDQLMARLESAAQQRQQSTNARAMGELETFRAKAEFLEDVRSHMGVLLAEAAQQGRGMTLQESYDMATWANPQIRGILQQREAAKAANAGSASTQRARAAASSVRGQPAGAAAPQSGGVRAALEAAAARLGSR